MVYQKFIRYSLVAFSKRWSYVFIKDFFGKNQVQILHVENKENGKEWDAENERGKSRGEIKRRVKL